MNFNLLAFESPRRIMAPSLDPKKTITHCDAETALDNGFYKSLPNDVLEQMVAACRNVQGTNQINVDRVRRKGDVIAQELAARERRGQEQQGLVTLAAGGVTANTGPVTPAVPGNEHLPDRLDPICRTTFSKEWLEQVISQIRPRIEGLIIHSVQLSSAPDHVAYVAEIPQGTTAHQANDFRYYRRYNFESVPMQDHEIRDVMNRKAHPRLIVSANFIIYPRPTKEGMSGTLFVEVKNESDVLARHTAIILHSPIRVAGKLIHYKNSIWDDGGEGWAYKLEISNHAGPPLFPRAKLNYNFQFKFMAKIQLEPDRELSSLRWVAFADSMPMQTGRFEIKDILQWHDGARAQRTQ
jgi:hypothetical protein